MFNITHYCPLKPVFIHIAHYCPLGRKILILPGFLPTLPKCNTCLFLLAEQFYTTIIVSSNNQDSHDNELTLIEQCRYKKIIVLVEGERANKDNHPHSTLIEPSLDQCLAVMWTYLTHHLTRVPKSTLNGRLMLGQRPDGGPTLSHHCFSVSFMPYSQETQNVYLMFV